MRTLLRSLSHSHAHNASECVRSHCASMCACVCAHFCKYFFSLLHSFSPPLFAFFSAQKPFLRYSIAVYNQIEIKRWITIITYNHHAYLVWLELRFKCTPYGKMNYYSKKIVFFIKELRLEDKRSLWHSKWDVFKQLDLNTWWYCPHFLKFRTLLMETDRELSQFHVIDDWYSWVKYEYSALMNGTHCQQTVCGKTCE